MRVLIFRFVTVDVVGYSHSTCVVPYTICPLKRTLANEARWRQWVIITILMQTVMTWPQVVKINVLATRC